MGCFCFDALLVLFVFSFCALICCLLKKKSKEETIFDQHILVGTTRSKSRDRMNNDAATHTVSLSELVSRSRFLMSVHKENIGESEKAKQKKKSPNVMISP